MSGGVFGLLGLHGERVVLGLLGRRVILGLLGLHGERVVLGLLGRRVILGLLGKRVICGYKMIISNNEILVSSLYYHISLLLSFIFNDKLRL